MVRDRFTGTAVLTAEQAGDLGTLGYVARASGLTLDARHDHPALAAPHPRTVHTRTEATCWPGSWPAPRRSPRPSR